MSGLIWIQTDTLIAFRKDFLKKFVLKKFSACKVAACRELRPIGFHICPNFSGMFALSLLVAKVAATFAVC